MRVSVSIKHQLLLAGLTVFVIALLTSITAAISRNTSLAQTHETEPNDDFEHANVVLIPGYITGSAWNSITDTDYFVMETPIGRQYQANMLIWKSDDLTLMMRLYDGDRCFVVASPYTSRLSWTAYTTTYYIQVAASVLTETIQTAHYLLSINWVAPTPTPTPFEFILPLMFKSENSIDYPPTPTPNGME